MTDFQKIHVHELLFEDIAGKLSPIGKRDKLQAVRRIFEMAVEEGIITQNPARGIKVKVPKKEQKVLSNKEAVRLLSEAKRHEHCYYPIWAFALFTGMRSGEMYAIRHSDIDLEARLIRVSKQFTRTDGVHETKGNNVRVVPISSELRPLLIELMSKGGFKETLWKWANDEKVEKVALEWKDLLLPRLRNWERGKQSTVLKKFCREIGITAIKFHDLRASFITNMLVQRVSISSVMKIVGHSKMGTTDKYHRLAGIEVQGSTEKLEFCLPSESISNEDVVPFSNNSS